MHIHILGIGGTFMGGLALIAREAGHTVSGADTGLYPPMSDMLSEQDIAVHEGYDAEQLEHAAQCIVVGNALSRGSPVIESMLDKGMDYRSGPQWLAENVLLGRWVLAVSGTHGKTTTASMLAWILDCAGLQPGFLIGGIPVNFQRSARLGGGRFFVVEADEYDSAFFDKRSKFVHFRPRTLIINNIEYDHADIFPDLAAIQRQFHHLIRTVPGNGLIIANADDTNIASVLSMGCWTPMEQFGTQAGAAGHIQGMNPPGLAFDFSHTGKRFTEVPCGPGGLHNARNALAAILAARHVGVPMEQSIAALRRFSGVKRRLELRGEVAGIRVYDDFAHHPTAIEATLRGLRAQAGNHRIIAVLEPRSNTMRLGVHRNALANALGGADLCVVFQPEDLTWSVAEALESLGERATVCLQIDAVVERLVTEARPGDRIVVMSNGAFGDLHKKLLTVLRTNNASRD